MSPTQAVAVLCEYTHRGYHQWYFDEGVGHVRPADCPDPYNDLDAFEAVAIAEKYLRDRP